MISLCRSLPRFLVGAILSLCLPAGAATWDIDQQQSSQWWFFPIDYWGQTFTPAKNNIIAAEFWFNNAGSYHLQIRDVQNGFAGTHVAWSDWQTVGTGPQVIQFSAPVPLTPGRLYLLHLDDSTPNFSGDTSFRGMDGNPYGGGAALDPHFGGNGLRGDDLYFKTYSVAAVPLPSAAALGMAAISLMALRAIRGHRR